ncbi:Glycosyltransferase [Halorubrum sp. DM2]|nr:Glycosyltransferase [Halorubrum sp. DM2]
MTKEAHALGESGHDVRLLCPTEPDRPDRETIDGIDVVRVRTGERTGLDRLRRNLSVALTGYRPEWAAAVAAHGDWIDVIHVHDLLLAGTALRVGDHLDAPVVVDCHENYPEAVRQWRRSDPAWWRSPPDFLERLAFPVWRYKRFERHWTKGADRLLTVAAEAERHYVRDCAVPPTDVTVVGNTVSVEAFDPATPPAPAVDGDSFVVGYVGSFGPHRGLETALRGIAAVESGPPEVRLLLVGDHDCPVGRRLRELAADLGVEDRVTFAGRVPFDDVPAYMAACDVCLVPHDRTPHTETTLPHKLYQYMAMARPVVVSDVAPLKRVVDETEAGRVVAAGDPSAFAAAYRALRADPDERGRLGANGRRAVEVEHNWERDAARLRDAYEQVLSAE